MTLISFKYIVEIQTYLSQNMFDFLNNFWLLKFIYKVARISGYVCTEIGFQLGDNVRVKNSLFNLLAMVVNFGLSLLVYTYSAHIPIANLTHSMLMDVAFNMIARMTVWLILPLKVANFIQRQRFFEIIANLQWNNKEVSSRNAL